MRTITTGILFSAIVILISCSGSNAPQPGTPAYYWAAARENFATGDYIKTEEHLQKLAAGDNEYTARARPWLLVMTSGMARGNMELADSFDAGGRATRTNQSAFRRSTNSYRGEANRLALEFIDAFDKFQKGKDEPVPLAFPLPGGNAGQAVQLNKVSVGMMLQPAELEPAEKHTIERGILRAACDVAGAPDDPAKTRELLKSGTYQAPHAEFVTAMANVLFEQSQLYGVRKIDNPERMKIFCNRALEALKTVPETKQTKELSIKITKSLKKT